jgi:hypothetical protein
VERRLRDTNDKEKVVKRIAWLIAALLGMMLPSLAVSQVKIAPACRVTNLPPGRCGWCALETLARHLGIIALYGLVDAHPGTSRPKELEAAVSAAAVKYRIQGRGCRATGILQNAVDGNLGAIVGFRPPAPGGRGHIVILIDFGGKEVRYLDPNDTDGRVRTLDVDDFLERWDGFVLVLERP